MQCGTSEVHRVRVIDPEGLGTGSVLLSVWRLTRINTSSRWHWQNEMRTVQGESFPAPLPAVLVVLLPCTAHPKLSYSHRTSTTWTSCCMYTNLQVAFRILKGRHSSRSWQTCCILELFLVFGREVTLVHPTLESSITFNSAWVNVKRSEYFWLYPLQANTQCLHWFCRSLLKHHNWKVCCESLTSSVNSV